MWSLPEAFKLKYINQIIPKRKEKKLKGKKINKIPGQYFVGDWVGRMAYLHQHHSGTEEGKKKKSDLILYRNHFIFF